MTERRTELRVGAAVVAAGLILVFGILWLGGYRFAEEAYEIAVVFDQVGGLIPGDRVTVAGLDAGEVKALEFREGRVRVGMEIDSDMRIPRDSRFVVASYGLIGAKHVAVSPGTSKVWIESGTVLAGRYEKGLGEVINEMGEALTEIRQILKAVDEVLSDLEARQQVKHTLANASRASEDLRVAIGDLKDTAALLKGFVEEKREPASSALDSIEEASAEFALATQRLAAMSASLDSILARVESGEGSLGKLVNDAQAYNEFLEVLKELRDIITRIKENPKSFVKFSLF